MEIEPNRVTESLIFECVTTQGLQALDIFQTTGNKIPLIAAHDQIEAFAEEYKVRIVFVPHHIKD